MTKILVVDDDDSVRKVLCGILKKHGYEVTEAEDGASAKSFPVHIIEHPTQDNEDLKKET